MGVHAAMQFGLTLVFVVVAVDTQQLAVAAVERVAVVVVVAVEGEFAQVGNDEGARATAAHPRVDLECAFAISLASQQFNLETAVDRLPVLGSYWGH